MFDDAPPGVGMLRLGVERLAIQPFRLRKRTFRGEGLLPELAEADWAEIRRRAYEGVAKIDLKGSHHRTDIAAEAGA